MPQKKDEIESSIFPLTIHSELKTILSLKRKIEQKEQENSPSIKSHLISTFCFNFFNYAFDVVKNGMFAILDRLILNLNKKFKPFHGSKQIASRFWKSHIPRPKKIGPRYTALAVLAHQSIKNQLIYLETNLLFSI